MLDYAKRFVPKKLGGGGGSSSSSSAPPPALDTTTTAAPATAADTTAVKSPVLSSQDEQFLENQLAEIPEEENIIFPGTSGTTTPVPEEALNTDLPATPPAAATPPAEETKEEEKKEEKKEHTGAWKNTLNNRWEGLRRTVSSAAATKRQKSRSKSRGKKPEEEKVDGEEEEDDKEKAKREKKDKEKDKKDKKGKGKEPEREEDELTAALERMNLAAEGGQAFTLSASTRALITTFTQILKDLINGVPTAYDDLIAFFDSSSTQLQETFDNLPSFLRKLVKTLPAKLSPEVAKAAAGPMMAEGLTMPGLKEIVTKPGAVMGLLKGVLNVLKTRFPALLGANMALSMGLFVVLLVLWYCYKRGKEVRLAQEAGLDPSAVEGQAAEPIQGDVLAGGVREDPLIVKGKKIA